MSIFQHPVNYEIIRGYIVTKNYRDGTCGIYTRSKKLLRIVEDGHLMSEIDELENDGFGADD